MSQHIFDITAYPKIREAILEASRIDGYSANLVAWIEYQNDGGADRVRQVRSFNQIRARLINEGVGRLMPGVRYAPYPDDNLDHGALVFPDDDSFILFKLIYL